MFFNITLILLLGFPCFTAGFPGKPRGNQDKFKCWFPPGKLYICLQRSNATGKLCICLQRWNATAIASGMAAGSEVGHLVAETLTLTHTQTHKHTHTHNVRTHTHTHTHTNKPEHTHPNTHTPEHKHIRRHPSHTHPNT